MTKEEALQKIEELKAFIENEDKQPGKRERVAERNRYWRIDSCGFIDYVTEMNKHYDKYRFSIGNHFKTREEAEHHKAKLIATQQLLDMCDATDDDIADTDKDKYYICYDFYENNFDVDSFHDYKTNNFIFTTEEKAQAAIDAMGDKLKLVFNIK